MMSRKTSAPFSSTTGTRLLGLREASQYLGLSYWTLRGMLYRGDLACVKAGRRILIDRQDLDSWIEEHKERFS